MRGVGTLVWKQVANYSALLGGRDPVPPQCNHGKTSNLSFQSWKSSKPSKLTLEFKVALMFIFMFLVL